MEKLIFYLDIGMLHVARETKQIYDESFTDTRCLGEYILFANPPICLIFDDTLYRTNKAD